VSPNQGPRTGFVSPARGVARLLPRQDLVRAGQAGVRHLRALHHVAGQPHQGDVELHRGHRGVPEALVAVDALHAEAALAGLDVRQVVLAQTHAPAFQLIRIATTTIKNNGICNGLA